METVWYEAGVCVCVCVCDKESVISNGHFTSCEKSDRHDKQIALRLYQWGSRLVQG